MTIDELSKTIGEMEERLSLLITEREVKIRTQKKILEKRQQDELAAFLKTKAFRMASLAESQRLDKEHYWNARCRYDPSFPRDTPCVLQNQAAKHSRKTRERLFSLIDEEDEL